MTGDREGTQLWAIMLSLDGWEKKGSDQLFKSCCCSVVNSMVKGTNHKYFFINNGKERLKKLPK